MVESVTFRFNDSTVVIIEGPFEANDHGIEHHTVSPITFRGDSSTNDKCLPFSETPEKLRNRISIAHEALFPNPNTLTTI